MLVVALSAIVYRPALTAYLLDDDFQWLADSLTFRPLRVFDVASYDHFYRPVLEFYFWTVATLFDGSPFVLHSVSILVHVLNAFVLMRLAFLIARDVRFSAAAGVLFSVMPGHIEAVTWACAIAEPLATLFGCSSVCWFVAWRASGGQVRRSASIMSFMFGLGTHESAVAFLPILLLSDWILPPGSPAESYRTRLGRYAPYLGLSSAYLVIAFTIATRSYLLREGEYQFGLHFVRNILGYITALYVGKQSAQQFSAVVLVLALLFAAGTPRARFSAGWIVCALLPFSFFTWGNISRYLYPASMGFALLLSEGLLWLDGYLAGHSGRRVRHAVVVIVLLLLAGRFTAFAMKAVDAFVARPNQYRIISEFLRRRPAPEPYSQVILEGEMVGEVRYRFLESMVRWEYRDPTLRVTTTVR